MMQREFLAGLRDGLPVCAGYFSVSFGFGALAAAQGLSIFQAALLSAVNLTSAGQFAGLTVMAAGAALLELILTQLVINSRYALMSLALGQQLGPKISTGPRLLAAFFNTDEIFALAMAKGKDLTIPYYTGTGLIAALGWIAGTALGAAAGAILPPSLRSALSVLLYGMFIAIVVPQTRGDQAILYNVLLALGLSCLFAWLPGLRQISSGLAIVLATVGAASISALLHPIEEDSL